MSRRAAIVGLFSLVGACVVSIACGPARPELAIIPLNTEPSDAGTNASDGDPDPADAGFNVYDADPYEAGTFSCSVKAPTECPDPPPRYPDVAPIFQRRCNICHSGLSDGPWPLTDYQHIADWWDIIRGNLLDCSMPPLDAGVPITREERLALLTWIRCALPQ